jgi:hypothetical protein
MKILSTNLRSWLLRHVPWTEAETRIGADQLDEARAQDYCK